MAQSKLLIEGMRLHRLSTERAAAVIGASLVLVLEAPPMIALSTWLLILAFAVPMIVSPGPGNTVLAAPGGQFGLRRTVPFWMGFEAGNLVH
jgi:hypothetical protein